MRAANRPTNSASSSARPDSSFDLVADIPRHDIDLDVKSDGSTQRGTDGGRASSAFRKLLDHERTCVSSKPCESTRMPSCSTANGARGRQRRIRQ